MCKRSVIIASRRKREEGGKTQRKSTDRIWPDWNIIESNVNGRPDAEKTTSYRLGLRKVYENKRNSQIMFFLPSAYQSVTWFSLSLSLSHTYYLSFSLFRWLAILSLSLSLSLSHTHTHTHTHIYIYIYIYIYHIDLVSVFNGIKNFYGLFNAKISLEENQKLYLGKKIGGLKHSLLYWSQNDYNSTTKVWTHKLRDRSVALVQLRHYITMQWRFVYRPKYVYLILFQFPFDSKFILFSK